MPEYYIRTPEHDESRGPFDASKLRTLAEAGQVSENTLFYDEAKEEWLPIALNEDLKNELFPEKQSLKLRPGMNKEEGEKQTHKHPEIKIEDMLKAAEGDTEENRHLKKSQKSFEQAVALASNALGIMLILSSIAFLFPHHSVIQEAASEGEFTGLLTQPFLLVGIFDLVMGILLLLAVTEVYPVIRGRSMLGVGFGLYLGWALGDTMLILAFSLGGAGIFLATLAQRLSTMLLAIAMGVSGNGALAYLAISGRFGEFYSSVQFNLFT